MTFNFDDLKFSVCPNFDRNAKIKSSQGNMLLLYPKDPQLHEKGANFSLLAYLHQKQPNLQVYIYSSKLYIDLYIQNFEMSIPFFLGQNLRNAQFHRYHVLGPQYLTCFILPKPK